MKKMKYLICGAGEIIIFSSDLLHRSVAYGLRTGVFEEPVRPVSGGFIDMVGPDNMPVCYGASETARVKCEEGDTEKVRKFLGILEDNNVYGDGV